MRSLQGPVPLSLAAKIQPDLFSDRCPLTSDLLTSDARNFSLVFFLPPRSKGVRRLRSELSLQFLLSNL